MGANGNQTKRSTKGKKVKTKKIPIKSAPGPKVNNLISIKKPPKIVGGAGAGIKFFHNLKKIKKKIKIKKPSILVPSYLPFKKLKILIAKAPGFVVASTTVGAGTLGTGVIGAGAVTAGKIKAGKLGAGALGAGVLGAGVVGTGVVGTGVVGTGVVGTGLLGAGTLGAATLGAGTLGAATLGTGALGAATLGTGAIGVGTLGAATLGTGAIGTAGVVGTGAIAGMLVVTKSCFYLVFVRINKNAGLF